jgi:hypothetical protein
LLVSTSICYQKELFVSGGTCVASNFLNLLLSLSNMSIRPTRVVLRTNFFAVRHIKQEQGTATVNMHSVVPAALPFACCTHRAPCLVAFFPCKQECWLRFLGVAVASSLDAVFACDAATSETSDVSSLCSLVEKLA